MNSVYCNLLLHEEILCSVLRWSVAVADHQKLLTVFGTEFSAFIRLGHRLKEAAGVFHPFFPFLPARWDIHGQASVKSQYQLSLYASYCQW